MAWQTPSTLGVASLLLTVHLNYGLVLFPNFISCLHLQTPSTPGVTGSRRSPTGEGMSLSTR